MEKNKREIGREKEEKAAVYLEQQGLTIVERNFYTKTGEIDIIAKEKEYLVFVEVKYRSNTKFGYPGEAITQKKKNTMIQTAKKYIKKYYDKEDIPYRFDVILFLGEQLEWIPNAFEK